MTYRPDPNYIMPHGKYVGYPADAVNKMDQQYLIWWHDNVDKTVFLKPDGSSHRVANQGEFSSYIGLSSYNFPQRPEDFQYSVEDYSIRKQVPLLSLISVSSETGDL